MHIQCALEEEGHEGGRLAVTHHVLTRAEAHHRHVPAQHAQLGERQCVAQPRAVPLGLPQQLQRLRACRVRGQHVPMLIAHVRRRAAPARAAGRDRHGDRDLLEIGGGDGVGQPRGVQQPLGSDGRGEALRRTCGAPRPLSPVSRLELPQQPPHAPRLAPRLARHLARLARRHVALLVARLPRGRGRRLCGTARQGMQQRAPELGGEIDDLRVGEQRRRALLDAHHVAAPHHLPHLLALPALPASPARAEEAREEGIDAHEVASRGDMQLAATHLLGHGALE